MSIEARQAAASPLRQAMKRYGHEKQLKQDRLRRARSGPARRRTRDDGPARRGCGMRGSRRARVCVPARQSPRGPRSPSPTPAARQAASRSCGFPARWPARVCVAVVDASLLWHPLVMITCHVRACVRVLCVCVCACVRACVCAG